MVYNPKRSQINMSRPESETQRREAAEKKVATLEAKLIELERKLHNEQRNRQALQSQLETHFGSKQGVRHHLHVTVN